MGQILNSSQIDGGGGSSNIIINGGCEVAQRANLTLSTTANYGKVDRFRAWSSVAPTGGVVTQGSASTANSTGNSVQFGSVSSSGAINLFAEQRVEGRMARQLIGSGSGTTAVASASILAHHDAGVNVDVTLTIMRLTTANDYSTATSVKTVTVSVPSGTPTLIKVENASVDNVQYGMVLRAQFTLTAATSNKQFYLANWQMNAGATARSFVQNPFDVELARCQRYFEKSYNAFTDPGASLTSGSVYTPSNSNANANETTGYIGFKVSKRNASWVGTYYDMQGNVNRLTMGGHNVTPTGGNLFSYPGENGYVYDVVAGSAANRYQWHWTADNEL